MRALFLRRCFWSWLVLISLLTHLFVAHHDGMAELVVCHRTNGDLVIESAWDHAHQLHEAEAELISFNPQPPTTCHDDDLSLVHPEAYTELSAFTLSLPSLPPVLSGDVRPARVAMFPVEFNLPWPPMSQRRVLSTTVLLI